MEEAAAVPVYTRRSKPSAQQSGRCDDVMYMPDVGEQALSEAEEEAESPPQQPQTYGAEHVSLSTGRSVETLALDSALV